ncbi:3-hydroxyacyl-CoA dehydrogenase [Venustampulla echinocandica]|uniref:3-hydroxyacyl-CoA dehydrogenase n=1 Tax=Venustampulla echinocandica TaxID=2656787 RepID=A0A370U3L3_9HELO|nr:3-hydroxyacyl-CoA dehydrogenase [Venustampulla echinocandica]RDL42365.1 3-hydroxyacyl-CoA dehydrogenase [Venustampulla echinocandica]
MKIEGRTFIVSGGASGLGRACVEDICRAGGYAAILDMNDELAQEVVKSIGGGKTKFFEANVLETESIAAAVKGALEWVKETGKEVGGVIAAAGVATPAKARSSSRVIIDRNLEPFSMSDFDFVMNVNVRGTIDLIRQVIPHMARSTPVGSDGERGIIVMVSSAAAFDGQPGQVSYSASKGAIASLTLPLTRDLSRYGIRVVTIAPSIFDSRMTAMMSDKVRASLLRTTEFPQRPGKPHEFAQLVTQSIENIMLNGVVLRLDGGMRMPSKM